MSPDLASRSAYAANPLARERRVRLRYAVELDLRYKLTWRHQVLHEGSGKTCDFSRNGVFFRADQDLPKGLSVELSIDWPMLLDGVCPLQLRIVGKVLRSSKAGTAVTIMRHQFCTRSRSAAAPGLQESGR
jgi:hypothetical protein